MVDRARLTAFVGVVLLFTVICLAMAAHFQAVLAASDLSASSDFGLLKKPMLTRLDI